LNKEPDQTWSQTRFDRPSYFVTLATSDRSPDTINTNDQLRFQRPWICGP